MKICYRIYQNKMEVDMNKISSEWKKANSKPTAQDILRAFGNEGADEAKAKEILSLMKGRKNQAEDNLAKIDKLLNNHGVEAIKFEGAYVDSYWRDTVAIYSNTGDTYAETILFDTVDEVWMLTSWGDFQEDFESNEKKKEDAGITDESADTFASMVKASVKKADASSELDSTIDEMVNHLEDIYDLVEVAGNKYFKHAEQVGKLDDKLLKLINKASPEDKKKIALAIIDSMKQNYIELGDTISSKLYEELAKYGDVAYKGKKAKYAIVTVENYER